MKKQFLLLSGFFFLLAVTFISCKKEKDTNNNNIESEATTHADDEFRISNELDAVSADANLMLGSENAFSGRSEEVQSLICDAIVAIDTTTDPRTITITYNGTNCLGNRTRTGVVILSMPQNVRWNDAGAVVTVTYQNLKITRLSDNKNITINGVVTFTNESGGLLINLPTLNSLTHLVNSSGITVTFDNGAQRNWQVARKQVYTYNNGVVLTVSGNHSENGISNIAAWGTNRFGGSFVTSTLSPLVIRQDCNARITEGALKHTTPLFTATSSFGLDANGNPASCPGTGNYFYKLEWTGPGGNTFTIILPY
jgi:hypothetical protein